MQRLKRKLTKIMPCPLEGFIQDDILWIFNVQSLRVEYEGELFQELVTESSPPARLHRGVSPENAATALVMPSNAICEIASLAGTRHAPGSGPPVSLKGSSRRMLNKWSGPSLPCSHPVSRWRHLTSSRGCVKDGCVLRRHRNSSPPIPPHCWPFIHPQHQADRGGSFFSSTS